MPSNKKSLSEEQIFADIMEMISSSNKKSKNVKNNNSKNNENKKTKNVKNKKNSKKNLKGGFAPLSDRPGDRDLSGLAEFTMDESNVGPNSASDAAFTMTGSDNASGPMGNSGTLMSGGKPKKRRVVKKSGVKKAGVKKAVKKSGVKKAVKKPAMKKVGAKKRVAKKVGAKKRVAKKSKKVAKK
jgi:hypothetical protein